MQNPNNKLNNWSEGREQAEDIMHGLGGENEDVADLVVKRGVVMMNDCSNCGWQLKTVVLWREICFFYLGHEVDGTKATRQGVWLAVRCKHCNSDTPVCIDWDEVRQYVDKGIRAGAISPEIKKALAQR